MRVGFLDDLEDAGFGTKKCAPGEPAPFLMNLGANLGLKFNQALWAAALVLAPVLSAGTHQCSVDPREMNLACANNAALAPVEVSDHIEITQYIMDFDGDHSLDLATVVEHPTGGYSRYTVDLRLASGAEQSIAVAGPPGGLQLEMYDMTGDKVPNDLVLRPALLRRFPTVLLNDGHNHFAVAISGTNPDSFSCGQALDSQGSDGPGTVALMSSGYKAGRLANDGGLFLPQVQEGRLTPTSQVDAKSLDYSSSSGRAPPTSRQ